MDDKTEKIVVKWIKVCLSLILMILAIWQGNERFSVRNDEAGIIFYAAAFAFGIAAVAFYFYKKQNK